jgi:hypothetical protein
VFYRLHGLSVVSDRAIPGLSAIESVDAPDLTFRFGPAPFPSSGTVEHWFKGAVDRDGRPVLIATRAFDGEFLRLAYCDGITFTIDRAAATIWIDVAADRTSADVPTYLLGPIIGLVLRLRGLTGLHASAVQIDGRAVVFTGPAGAGKSTLAGAFAVRGFPVMADDTIVLRPHGREWTVSSGYPRLRLWPESAEALMAAGGRDGFLPPGVSGSMSRYHLDLLSPGRHFSESTAPLGVVYLLGDVSAENVTSVAPVSPADALIALVANTYANALLDRHLREREFQALGDLVQTVPVRRLTRPADLAHLSSFCDRVFADLEGCEFAWRAVPA